jgi:hypothetical protein
MEEGRKNGYRLDWLLPRERSVRRSPNAEAGGLLLQDRLWPVADWSDNSRQGLAPSPVERGASATTPSVPRPTSLKNAAAL